MEKNQNENTCPSCGHCGGCGKMNAMCGGCHGMGDHHGMLRRFLMLLILVAVFYLGTEVGELKSINREYHHRGGYGMMGNYGYGNSEGMMGWRTVSPVGQPVIMQPQVKEITVTNKAPQTSTKK